MTARCPTTGLFVYPTADIAWTVAYGMRPPSGAVLEARPCPDADHWHIRRASPPRSRWGAW